MTDDIWKTAPEGATHFSKVRENGFYKKNGDNWLFFHQRRGKWIISLSDDKFHKNLIPRPALDWHKSNELPPVGTECEFFMPDHISRSNSLRCKCGSRVEILFHFTNQGLDVAAYKFMADGEVCIDYAISDCFRPIKSEREKAIEKMLNLFSGSMLNFSDAKKACEIIYDAGLRFMTQDTER